jgi:oligopeptide transport system substrate-binding protein
VRLAKNPLFFDAPHVCVDRINYYPTADVVSAERRVQRGELDINTTFQSNRLQHIQAVMPGYARPALVLATYYLSFNTRDVKPLQDVRVRRALSEAIDREFITWPNGRSRPRPCWPRPASRTPIR